MSAPAPTSRPGRRIAVVGVSGCGKTTVAQAIAQRLGCRYVCNDAIIHGPDWRMTAMDERVRRFAEAFDCPAWVVDGNCNSGSADDVFIRQSIDTLVWLDLPRRVVMPQLLRRTMWRAYSKEELWHGNRETWRNSFASRESILWWAIKTHGRIRRAYAEVFSDPAYAHLVRIRFTTRQQIAAWLAILESAKADSTVHSR